MNYLSVKFKFMAIRILDNKQVTPETIRLMLEVTPECAVSIAIALEAQARGVQCVFKVEENIELLQTSKKISMRISEGQAEYPGKLYEIWAKGKIRKHLGFRREKDMYMGKEYGRNFLDACLHFFTNIMYCNGAYNERNNTLSGHVLYGKAQSSCVRINSQSQS
jgi:hypothetical protein